VQKASNRGTILVTSLTMVNEQYVRAGVKVYGRADPTRGCHGAGPSAMSIAGHPFMAGRAYSRPRQAARAVIDTKRLRAILPASTAATSAGAQFGRHCMATANSGHFVWYEHLTTNAQAAIAFYTEVVGWKTQPFPEGGDYVMWVGSQGPLGGVYQLPDQAAAMGAPPHWMGHVQVDDVDATVKLAVKLGGKVHKQPTDIPTIGRFAVIADPQGAPISVFKPMSGMERHDLSKEGELCWNELLTSDSASAVQFYSALLGWNVVQEMDMGPMGTYRIFGLGDEAFGGMMTVPSETPAPAAWMYYVNTLDLDATLARATKRGAKVINGPMEVPGGGRIVQLTDPQGVAFALHQGPKT